MLSIENQMRTQSEPLLANIKSDPLLPSYNYIVEWLV